MRVLVRAREQMCVLMRKKEIQFERAEYQSASLRDRENVCAIVSEVEVRCVLNEAFSFFRQISRPALR